jgi:hypothetical protein
LIANFKRQLTLGYQDCHGMAQRARPTSQISSRGRAASSNRNVLAQGQRL